MTKTEIPAGAVATTPNCGVVALAATTGHTISDTATSTGRGYIVRVGGHFVAVTRGQVIDQMQSAPAADHWAANKRVSHAAEIVL